MSEKKLHIRTYGIRTNVILGFTFAFLTVMAAGYFTYESTSKLLKSVIELSRPGKKLPKLRETFSVLTEAENNMRIYILMKDEEYFENYLSYIKKANKNIDTLKLLTAENYMQFGKVSQISVLLNTRLRNIDEFMIFKRAADSVNYSKLALEKLRETTPDTTRTRIYTQTSVTESLIDTLLIEQPGEPKKVEESKSFFSRIASLFSSKEEKTEEIIKPIEQVLRETKIVRDTSILVQTDTVLLYRIQKILNELKVEETQIQAQLFEKELELLKNNSLIISQIMDIIAELEGEETALVSQQITDARDVAGKSVVLISSVMLASLFIIMIFLFFILRSISRSNFFRNQLFIAKQKAEQLAKAKEDFLATMSHEIRTPLNSIVGFSEQLSRTALDKEQTDQLNAVKISSDHLLSLVNDILDFSKLEQGKLKLEKIPFSVEDVMAETYRTFRIRAKEKGIGFGYHIEFDNNEKLIGDPLRLKQILFNLVGNAIKFTERGKVFVICRKTSSTFVLKNQVKVRFEVHDTGIGIHPEKLNSIFEGFTQADSSLSRKFGGTGLGLTISKSLIEMQDGLIGVASEEGKGSVFYFEIPYTLADADDLLLSIEMEKIESDVLKDKYILLVDDDPFNIKLTTMILERWDVRVDFASSGKKALEMIMQSEYDLILTDIHMPDMSGIELTQKIRTIADLDKASMPVIAITANIMKDDLDHYMKSGMDDYVLKPYRESELFMKLAEQFGFDYKTSVQTLAEKPDKHTSEDMEFDLSDVKRFAGGNKKAVAVIINSFVDENTKNIKTLEANLKDNNYEAISALAHRMVTSYAHLGMKGVTEDLLKLEKINGNPQHREVKNLIASIRKKSASVFPKLKKKVKEYE